MMNDPTTLALIVTILGLALSLIFQGIVWKKSSETLFEGNLSLSTGILFAIWGSGWIPTIYLSNSFKFDITYLALILLTLGFLVGVIVFISSINSNLQKSNTNNNLIKELLLVSISLTDFSTINNDLTKTAEQIAKAYKIILNIITPETSSDTTENHSPADTQ